MKQYTTVELVKELLRRAEHVDAVLDLVNSRVATTEPLPPKPTRGNGAARKGERLYTHAFLEAISQATHPRTARQMAKAAGTSPNGALAHLRKLTADGKVRRLDGPRPHLYEVIR